MSAVLTPTGNDVRNGPQPFRWTVEQYLLLGAIDGLRGVRTTLIDGVIYRSERAGPPHDTGAGLTHDWLRAAFPGGHVVRPYMGFVVGPRAVLSPDLAVVRGAVRDYMHGFPTEAVLVAEVADMSLYFDTTVKAELYATAGVPDYWVLDVDGRRLIVHRDPEPLPAGLGATAYRTRFTLGPADTVAPLAAPHAAVRVADLLP